MPRPLRYLLWRAAALALAVALVLAVRAFVAAPHAVPGAAMLPTLWPGDRILVTPLRDEAPARGDVVTVRVPAGERIRRVVALPGDRIAVRGTAVLLNGRALPRYRVADLLLPLSPNLRCPVDLTDGDCRLQRHRETLPDGRAWDVVDGPPQDIAAATVPAGRVFLLPDHRGRAGAEAVGLVPADTVTGRAGRILWSVDRPTPWVRFWRWGATLRRARLLKEVERTPAAALGSEE